MTFDALPWYLDVIAFLLMGSFLAVIFAFIPITVCGTILVSDEPTAKLEYTIWSIVAVCFLLGGYMVAFLILLGIGG